MMQQDTIAACATPPGRGGIGVIRVSGPDSLKIASAISGKTLTPRYASFATFVDEHNNVIDEGLVIYFNAPNSFTGEEVVELQGHGGPVVMDRLLSQVIKLGARQANPGEFSERAFLNDKLDLAQAEAIADLIDAQSEQAANSAVRTLQGEFSKTIHDLVEQLTHLRMYVEAAIDFPEEEIDFLNDKAVTEQLEKIKTQLSEVENSAKQGVLLKEGMRLVIAGKPNAGKSSLLNALSGQEHAIVTDIPGTTRDVLSQYIQIDGMPLHVIDTAGLRDTDDVVEKEGVRRAEVALNEADRILLLADLSENEKALDENAWPTQLLNHKDKVILVGNKIDLTKQAAGEVEHEHHPLVYVSAKTGVGLDALKSVLKRVMGYQQNVEGQFSARRRHLDAIARAKQHVFEGEKQLSDQKAGELLAEELRLAQEVLSQITGEFTSDDLLGEIFSSFCIGK